MCGKMFRLFRWILILILVLGRSALGGGPVVYCINTNTNLPGLTPMARISCASDTPATAVANVSVEFAHLSSQHRTLYLNNLLEKPRVFTTANLPSIIANGANCSNEIAYLQMIFAQMRSRNLIPSRIVLDFEDQLVTWSLTIPTGSTLQTVLLPIYGSSACTAKMPASVLQYSAADYPSFMTVRGRAATIAWNNWQLALAAQTLRQTLVPRLTAAFGASIPITNFNDIHPSFPVYDLNNWPATNVGVGNESSPAAYLDVTGSRYSNLQKDVRWNRLIDALNCVRSAIRNGPVLPWVSYPTFSATNNQQATFMMWLWREEIKHFNQMGITQYLYFNPPKIFANPGATSVDDLFASQVFQSLQVPAVKPTTIYNAIPLDANSITTGNVTTTYKEFLANLPGGAAGVIK